MFNYATLLHCQQDCADRSGYQRRYDTVHGAFKGEVKGDSEGFYVNGKKITVFAHMNAKDIPWGEAGADYVCESTGVYTDKAKASAHLSGGAKKVGCYLI